MNWTEFFQMNGYAFYVWGAYGVTALFLLVELMQLVGRRRATLKRIRQIQEMGDR